MGSGMDEIARETLEVYDIQRLLKLLPHRYPFLLVDRIIEANGDQSCIGIKNVSANEPQFQGHFPGQPSRACLKKTCQIAPTCGNLSA